MNTEEKYNKLLEFVKTVDAMPPPGDPEWSIENVKTVQRLAQEALEAVQVQPK